MAEITAVSNYLASFLPLPQSPSAKAFQIALTTRLSQRYAQHWHSQDPERGSAFRALSRLGRQPELIDQRIILAAQDAGIGSRELSTALLSTAVTVPHQLGDRWTIWVDPSCVCLRIDRGELTGRDTVLLEIWGRLPANFSSSRAPGALTIPRSLSLNISNHSTSPEMDLLISPTKRSKAIMITAPPIKPISAMAQLLLASPLPLRQPSSPFVTPPTPLRPSSAAFTSAHADVFSAPQSLAELSLRSHSAGLVPASLRPQRSLSRASSCDDGSGSDGELGAVSDGGSSIFSAESVSSSVTSLGGVVGHSFQGRHTRSCSNGSASEVRMDGEFKYPPVPSRSPSYGTSNGFSFPPIQSHPRSNSFSSNNGSTYVPTSPTKLNFNHPHSLPSSPSKPRRRGTRGAGSSHHESSSSISSITSIISNTQQPNLANPRTRAQALAGTLTEHSGGKVVVLGGGVLLGLAGGSASTRSGNNDGRRVRERRSGR